MEPAAADLVPRIKHAAFLQALVRAGVPEGQWPVIESLCGELCVTYAFDRPGQFVLAQAAQIERTGLPRSEWRTRAVDNLRAGMRRDGLAVSLHRPRPPVIDVRSGGDVEACLLLIDDFWQHVQGQFGAPVYAAAPRRDRLYVVCDPDARAIGELTAVARQSLLASQDPHGLSAQVMRLEASGWRILDAGAPH